MTDKTLKTIADTNTLTTLLSSDLLYVAQSPYGVGDDSAISGAGLSNYVIDTVGGALIAGTNVSIIYDASANTIEIRATASGQTVDLSAVSAAISANTAAILSVNSVVSSIEDRISAVSTLAASGNVAISALQTSVTSNQTAITSVNVVVSSLEDRISAVSAITTMNDQAIASVDTRISNVSVLTTDNQTAITSVNTVVSSLDSRLSAVSVLAGSAREILTADRTYYVDASAGSDSNNGLTVGTAFATIQKAIDVGLAVDNSIYQVTIQVQDGTYNEVINVDRSPIGGGLLKIVGNVSSPGNVLLTSSNNPTLRVSLGARLEIGGMDIRSSSARAIQVQGVSRLSITEPVELQSTLDLIRVLGNSYMRTNTDITLRGNCTTIVRSQNNSTVEIFPGTITFVSVPAITDLFTVQNFSMCELFNVAFSGSVAGRQFNVTGNSIIDTNGITIPGTTGFTSTGGRQVT